MLRPRERLIFGVLHGKLHGKFEQALGAGREQPRDLGIVVERTLERLLVCGELDARRDERFAPRAFGHA